VALVCSLLTIAVPRPYTGHETNTTRRAKGEAALSPQQEADMIVMDGEEFLTAQETCALLGVKPATLYAYVSRGMLHSYRQGIKRMRLYRRNEVERLTRLRHPEGADDGSEQDNDAARDDGHAWIPYV
jgi:excisionase family DNA binding protein